MGGLSAPRYALRSCRVFLEEVFFLEKSKRFNLRLTADEAAALEELAERHGSSKTDAVIFAVFYALCKLKQKNGEYDGEETRA